MRHSPQRTGGQPRRAPVVYSPADRDALHALVIMVQEWNNRRQDGARCGIIAGEGSILGDAVPYMESRRWICRTRRTSFEWPSWVFRSGESLLRITRAGLRELVLFRRLGSAVS